MSNVPIYKCLVFLVFEDLERIQILFSPGYSQNNNISITLCK